MATATLRGSTQLNTSGMRRGFAQLSSMVKQFKAEVGAPFAEAAGSLMTMTKRAALCAAAVAGIAVKDIFDGEIVDKQFHMLNMSLDEAKARTEELRKMGMENDETSWFDPGQWEQSALILHRLGAEALDNNDFLRLIGDAAAKSQLPLEQMTKQVADLYTRLKTGRDFSRSGITLVQQGLISPAAYKELVEMKESGADFGKVWSVVTRELSRSRGAMEQLAMTGKGQFGNLKTILGESLETIFSGLADKIRDIVYKINSSLIELYNNGTFERWAEQIGNSVDKIVNWLWRCIQAYQNLDSNTRSQLNSIIGVSVAAFAGWKMGFLGPMIQGLFGLTKFAVQNFKAVGGAAAAFATAYAGFKLGKTIYESLSPEGQSVLEKIAVFIEGVAKTIWEGLKMVGNMAAAGWKKIMSVFNGDEVSFGDEMKKALLKYLDESDKIAAETKKMMNATNNSLNQGNDYQNLNSNGVDTLFSGGEKKSNPEPGKQHSFTEAFQKNFKKNFSLETLKKDLKSVFNSMTPDSVKKFMDEFGKVEKLEFPKMPEAKPLAKQLDIPGAIDGVNKLKKAMMPLRGIYADLPKLSGSRKTVEKTSVVTPVRDFLNPIRSVWETVKGNTSGGFGNVSLGGWTPANALAGAMTPQIRFMASNDDGSMKENSSASRANTLALTDLNETMAAIRDKGVQALWGR